MRVARLRIVGRVQGVGYRDWAISAGQRLGLRGWVRNRTDGSVEALIAGDDLAVSAMIDACRGGPAHARVDNVDVMPAAETDILEGFARLPTA